MSCAILYSDQVTPENGKVDDRLIELMARRGRQIGYIASGPDPDHRFFLEKQVYYARMGLDLELYYDLEQPREPDALERLLSCNMIHLSGGSTQAFLRRIRASDMVEPLRKWFARGGLIVGTSAGAMIMTPTIALDALFNDGQPEDITDGTALDLLPFEFFPHVHGEPAYLPKLLDYSRHNSRPIVGCPDGDGVIVTDGALESLGDVIWIAGGAIIEAPEQL